MKKYMKHPVLVNPTRWLESPKLQGPDCYISAYSNDININPFAKSLVRTHKDSSSYRFPNGCLITLVTEPITNKTDNSDAKTHIRPELHFDSNQIKATSYILKNRKFLDYVDVNNLWMRYVSIKYKNYNSSRLLRNVSAVEKFSDSYRELLEGEINRGLSDLEPTERPTEGIESLRAESEGLQLVNSGQLLQIQDHKVKINLPGINQEIMVGYENEELCTNIISLIYYYV